MLDKIWPTKRQDIDAAEEIIESHMELNDGYPLGLFELNVHNSDNIDFKVADWVIEIADYFNGKYGDEKGIFVTQQIVSRCLRNGATLN